MSHPSNHSYPGKVRFESPMETEESSYSSEAGTPVNVGNPRELIFPTLAMHCPNSLRVHLGMSLPMAQPLLVPRFNFGMDLDMPATPFAAPPTLKFNFGMNLCIPGAIPPSSLALHTLQPFNLEFSLPLPAQQPAPKPFNMGFNLPVQSTGMPLPTTSQPFNLGFNLPMAVTTPATSFGLVLAQADTSRHVGYDINNRSFQFGCKPPSPIVEWQPELIRALHPLLSVASPPAIADAAPGPSIPRPLPHTFGHVERPKLKSLVGDTERSAIDIVKRLGSEEFDHVAQMMVSGALGPGDDVRDPKPDEVLESNQMMLM
ncbi:hypothetical protein BDR07DRAFT_1482167 [Suillus spraguei]|nr:hypothetical protein BDR07DRAFT_1482167 [Suillus spraguei]